MINDIIVDITIKDNTTGSYLRIPVIPTAINYMDGDATANSVTIIQLGAVDFPNGSDLKAASWESFFPARYDAGYCSYSDLKTPLEYKNILSAWKDAGTSLQLIIPAAGINKAMYLKSCNWTYTGFEGDISYSLSLTELRILRPIQIPIGDAIKKKANKTPAARPAVPKKPAVKTYKVIPGDYLIKIAKKVGVKDWHTIYNANKAKIKNPNLIYPGQVFIIP